MARPETIAAMGPADFKEKCVFLGGMRATAALLNRAYSTVVNYSTGRMLVPELIASRITQLCEQRLDKMRMELASDEARRRLNIAAINEARAAQREMSMVPGRVFLANRRTRASPRQYPPYRMNHEKVTLLARALKRYLGFIRGERQQSGDPQRIQDLDMELRDISLLARQCVELIETGGPYDFNITNQEWYVVSRALRFLHSSDHVEPARSLYRHWNKYKGLHFVSHGKYAHHSTTGPANQPEVTHVIAADTDGEGTTRLKVERQAGDPTRHRDIGRDPNAACMEAQQREAAQGGLGEEGAERDVEATIITGTTHAQAGHRQRADVGRGNNGPTAVQRAYGGGTTGQSCPACGAGPQDDCRPGCALA